MNGISVKASKNVSSVSASLPIGLLERVPSGPGGPERTRIRWTYQFSSINFDQPVRREPVDMRPGPEMSLNRP
ncbi:hypothetical protein TNCV_694711 [Trichonephila clavipes]|nr:hypothetical protein TNCV_694711 [Trichonephila clavipes]